MFMEFEDEKTVDEYVNAKKDFHNQMKNPDFDLTIKVDDRGIAKRTIALVTSHKKSGMDLLYIYSQHGNYLVEIMHVGLDIENDCNMLDELGY